MRIQRLILNDFRAFPGPQDYTLDLSPSGCNVLLYGENGSGKPSLFRALQEFLRLDGKGKPFLTWSSKNCSLR